LCPKKEKEKGGQVRYWQYGPTENLLDLPISDLSPFFSPNDATSTLALTVSLVTLNQAAGSPGIGGGIFTLGTFTFDAFTIILFNYASASGDYIGS
jgi:hypothetical protein